MADKDKFEVEDGSCPIDQNDIIKMLWVLLRQSQENNPGTAMRFPLAVFKTLPGKLEFSFQKVGDFLEVSVPYETKRTARKRKNLVLTPAEPQLVLPNQGILDN
jgi:hypothetical protein